MSIAIIDYDMANLRSVQKALEAVGHHASIVREAAELGKFDRIVLPGVGAFMDAARILRERGFVEPIKAHVKAGKPLLGICLGLQVLFDVGYEDGKHEGLGIFGGECVRFDVDQTHGLKVPHMGWNQLTVKHNSPLFKGVEPGSNVYFVHSYHVKPKDAQIIATTTDYGGEFVSSIWKDNVVATQFHPEKSQAVGLKLLENFGKM